ncbi:MAG TPA: AIPR family protein [Bosea sp. (in: a-proteobacteria)]|jgi:hypothetical protein|nr:AIPR family protein [Bosea sp. (in: a-proteobacteria)]
MAAKDAVYAAALRKNPTLRLFYVTTGSGEKSRQISQLLDTNLTRFKDLNIFDDVEIEIFGAKDLQNGYRSATNSITSKIEINKPITLPAHPAVQEAFLGFIDADQLVRLVTVPSGDHGERRINRAVFFDNIRDFNPKSEINLGILKELKDGKQESFVFKNNGVTVVAKEINRRGDSFELDDYQVVNGCQTSNILFLAGDDAKGVSVPFRLIGSNDSNFVASIIIGTNKQNEVKEDQFWALTPFMKDLEEFCREQGDDLRLFIERRENQYRNEIVERTRICRPGDLVKAMAAMFLFQPHRAARDYRGIRKEFSERIFQDAHSVVPYHTAAFAAYRTDFVIRNRRLPNSWGIYKYYVLASIGYKLAGAKDVFSLNKAKIAIICTEITKIFLDEDLLLSHYTKVAEILNRMIVDSGIEGRERIRDFIRSETVAKNFEIEFSR